MFLPSYRFLDKLKAAWEKSGLLAKLAAKKPVPFFFKSVQGALGRSIKKLTLFFVLFLFFFFS